MRDLELEALAVQIAVHLGACGWTLQPRDDREARGLYLERSYFRKSELRFSVNRGWRNKDRLEVCAWAWPAFKKVEHGQERGELITPALLWDPKETSPSISVAIARGPEAIAREIQRRFIPEYARIYARCKAKADASQEYEDKSASNWAEVCKLIGKNPAHGRHYVDLPEGGTVTVELRGGKAHLEFYAGGTEVAAILRALGVHVPDTERLQPVRVLNEKGNPVWRV